MGNVDSIKKSRKFKPTRRGDLVTRLVNGAEIWYFDDYVKQDRFDTPKRVRLSTGCEKADYEHAKDVRDQIRTRLKDGEAEMRRALTFAEWIPLYRETYEREPRHGKDISAGTLRSHTSMLPHLIAFFGKLRLDRISDADCLAFRNKRLADTPLGPTGQPLAGRVMSKNTVLKECHFAASVMADAVRAGRAPKNPWLGLFKHLGQIGSRERVLSLDDLQRIFGWCEYHNREAGRYVALTIGLGGLRIGGMLALSLRPVVEAEGEYGAIEVMSKGQLVRQPLMRSARALIDEQTAYICGYRPKATRLFPYHEWTVGEWIRKMCEATGVEKFTSHDIRRTFGTATTQQLGIETAAFLMNNTPAVAARHYNKPLVAVVDQKKLKALEAVADSLPTLDAQSVTSDSRLLQVARA